MEELNRQSDTQNPEDELDIGRLTSELGELREEKRLRHLTDYAREALRSRGLEAGFAMFLTGTDEKKTGRNIAEFEKYYTAALATEIAKRFAKEPPADFPPPSERRVRRGVRTV